MINLSDIFNNLDDIIVVKDDNDKIIYNNKPYDYFIDAVKNDVNGEIYNNQQKKWFMVKTKPMVMENKKYSIIIFKDVTKYKQREQILIKQGICDELTGIYNRQGITCSLNQLTEQFEKSKNPFTVIMGDIDHFKQINDTHGHSAGDLVLSTVGSILKNSIRKEDFVGRYGGEEFLIILNTDNMELVTQRIEQIRKSVERYEFFYKEIPINITMTFGIQMFDGTKDVDHVIEEADKALYYGKEHGRNQIILYDNVRSELNNSNKKSK